MELNAKFLQLLLSRTGKNSVKNSWILILISTIIGWLIADETSHPSKNS